MYVYVSLFLRWLQSDLSHFSCELYDHNNLVVVVVVVVVC